MLETILICCAYLVPVFSLEFLKKDGLMLDLPGESAEEESPPQ